MRHTEHRDLLVRLAALQGSLLVTTYVLVAVACWYEDRGSGVGEELPLPVPPL